MLLPSPEAALTVTISTPQLNSASPVQCNESGYEYQKVQVGPRPLQKPVQYTGQGRAGQGRAGQGRAGQDRTGQDRTVVLWHGETHCTSLDIKPPDLPLPKLLHGCDC